MMDDSSNDAIDLHLAKLLDEHLLRDRRDRPLEIREPQHPSSKQVEEDEQFPAPLEDLEGVLHTPSRRRRRQLGLLTFR